MAQTVSFNFSNASQPVSGWINVAGDPSSAVRTVTDPTTGIALSSVATANWSPFGNCAYDGGGASGSNPFFPNAVMANHWFNYSAFYGAYNALMPQLVISGLNVDSVYTFKMTGSFTVNVPSQFNLDPIRYTVSGTTLYGYVDIDGDSNYAAGATFHNVAPDSSGRVRIYVNTYGGSNVASICGVQIISGRTISPTPTVNITSPTNNTIVPEDGNVIFNATASETNGAIARVEFYAGSTLIGSDSAAPYSMTWFSPNPGAYVITARAIDGTGNISTSSVNITVESLNYFWSTTGNIATGGDTSFVGTVDSNRLAFRTNNTEHMSIGVNGTTTLGKANNHDSTIINGVVTINDSVVNTIPLTINANSIYSPFINLYNTNSNDGASIGMRYYNDSGLVAQFFSGSYINAFVPNGYAFHQLSTGGFEFVGAQATNYVSWGDNFKKLGGSEMIFYPHTGHLIIGSTTDSGNNKLQVNGITWTTGLTIPTGATAGYVLTSDASGHASWQPGGGAAHWSYNGGTNSDSLDNIGIGTSNTQGYRLAVNGAAVFTKVVVKPQASWPDYVFKKGYGLPGLDSLEHYIQDQHHLPGIASAEEVARNGIDVGEQQTQLVKKLEEQSLYLIAENKALQGLTSKVAELDKEMNRLKRENTKLKKKLSRGLRH